MASGITVVFTGHAMKVGGSGKVFDEFVEKGQIIWPKEFKIIRFDETFTYGNNCPQNGMSPVSIVTTATIDSKFFCYLL